MAGLPLEPKRWLYPAARSSREMVDQSHSINSSAREKLIEHLFIGELQKHLWAQGIRNAEILHSEVDSAGYDIVFDVDGIMRHIQLKASYQGAKTSRVNISLDLARKQSGCVIWVGFDRETLNLGTFLWFGGLPGEKLPPLGDKTARHSKGNSDGVKLERPNLRVLNKGSFERLHGIDALAAALFGPLE